MKIKVGTAIGVAMFVAMLSSQTVAQQKTVRACQEEWRANKAANQAAGIRKGVRRPMWWWGSGRSTDSGHGSGGDYSSASRRKNCKGMSGGMES
jgi:hypothetical protein